MVFWVNGVGINQQSIKKENMKEYKEGKYEKKLTDN